jgi:cytochrome P450
MPPVCWVPDHGGYWFVGGHRDVAMLLADSTRFSSQDAEIPRLSAVRLSSKDAEIPRLSGVQAPAIPFQLDPPQHGPVRRILDAALVEPVTDRLETAVRAAARRLLAGMSAQGQFELVDDFAVPLVAAGLWRLLGLRWPDESFFIDRCKAMMRRLWTTDGTVPIERLDPGSDPVRADVLPPAEEFGSYDMVEELVLKAIDEGLERDQGVLAALRQTPPAYFADQTTEMHNLAVGLTAAAMVNTVSAAVGAVEHLGLHPADRHTLLGHRDRIAPAVEELLRLYPPQSPARIVVRDTCLRGEQLRVGDGVLASIREANRDGEVFSHPDRFTPDRASKRHLTFGAGRHHCAGASFARMVLRVMLEELHAAVPHYRVSASPDEVCRLPMRVPLRRLLVEPTPDRSTPA